VLDRYELVSAFSNSSCATLVDNYFADANGREYTAATGHVVGGDTVEKILNLSATGGNVYLEASGDAGGQSAAVWVIAGYFD